MTGVWVLVGAVVVAAALGTVMHARDGRFRHARGRPVAAAGEPVVAVAEPAGADGPSRVVDSVEAPESGGAVVAAGGLRAELAALGEVLGERATLLQFSTAFCAPCRSTRQVLAGVAALVPGVRHVEVDAEAHLDLVRRLAVRRTPTVLIVDASGREVRRASGAPPTRQAVFATLAQIVPADGTKRADGDSSEPPPAS